MKRFSIKCCVCHKVIGTIANEFNLQNAICNDNLCSIVYEKHIETNKINPRGI